MVKKASESGLREFQPECKRSNKTLGLHCVDIEIRESVDDSNSRVIQRGWCARVIEDLSSASRTIVSSRALIA